MIVVRDMAGTAVKLECSTAVIKLGSGVVIGSDHRADLAVLESLAEGISHLHRNKVKVIIVTSGAIGIGCGVMERSRPRTLPEKQAMAAVGQISLMHTYQTVLADRGLHAAQVLLTRDDMEDRHRYLNVRYTLERLLRFGAIPIINENDTTSTEEISFGDNDMLSTLVAVKMKADLLLLLSTVDGVHRYAPPGAGSGAAGRKRRRGKVIPVIAKFDRSVYDLLDSGRSPFGKGGMRTKLDAAKTASEAGVHTVIVNGREPEIIEQVFTGRFKGTFFPAARDGAISARARWIGFGRAPRGNKITLDAGAIDAVKRKKTSLLPVGVTAVHGNFKRGDVAELCDRGGRPFARGLVNYSSEEIEKIMGHKASEIGAILGYRNYDEIVHRDNLAVLEIE